MKNHLNFQTHLNNLNLLNHHTHLNLLNLLNLLPLLLLFLLFLASCAPETTKITSPNNRLSFELHATNGSLEYAVHYDELAIIKHSKLGFRLTDDEIIGENLSINYIDKTSSSTMWKPVYGEQSFYEDNYNEILIEFESDKNCDFDFKLRVRAYNEGLAFRYEFNNQIQIDVAEELTEFSIDSDPTVWISDRAQSPILRKKLSSVKGVFERPLLAEFNDSIFLAMGEAALVDFARMKFAKDSSSSALKAHLEIPDTSSVIIPKGDYSSPWRFIMLAQTPAQILQNNHFVLNLNPENQISNHPWIKPGKIIREVTLTTKGGIACVDFAVKHNLQFVEFDAGWYGNEYDKAADACTITVDPKRSPGPLDLHQVIDYANERGIGIILYVNRNALEKQIDDILPLYQSWGVAGLKYGFVRVGSQDATRWMHQAVVKAAKYELMVDIHDEYRPTGFSRTYPNLMTQEGIRGDEESPPNEMVINTIFTRMIAGAGDQTNCYFADRVDEKMGSHASQMAKAICIYSPWQFLYWYDRPQGSPGKKGGAGGADGSIPEIPDLDFYSQLPTVWDKTIILDGYPGEFVSIARKKDENWYIGVLCGFSEKEINIDLSFLEPGKNYDVKIYTDHNNSDSVSRVNISSAVKTSKDHLKHSVSKRNGMAAILMPRNIE